MSPWPSSLRARLTLWYTVLLGLPLIAFAVICYVVFARTLQARTDQFIGDALTAFSREVAAERRTALSAADAMRSTVNEVRFRDLNIVILDSARAVVATTEAPDSDVASGPPPADLQHDLVTALQGRDLTSDLALTLPSEQGPQRIVVHPLDIGGHRFSLVGTYSLVDISAMLERIRGMFLVVIPLLVVCAATGGSFLAKRSLAPVATMAAHAAEISASTLHERLPVAGGDELVRLARVVNDLLDRLEQSFAQQRRFVADASHELRTPTAIVRTEADVTLSRPHRAEEEYRASVTIMRDASRRLTRIVDDLFLLARADAGNLVARREALYLEDVVHDATNAVGSVADQRGVRVELKDVVEAPFHGDADLLGRLVLNLLDNAIKHSPEGGAVDVALSRRNGVFEISVSDTGPGIPPEARERVFERFFRLDTARSRGEQADSGTTSGAGLGLAIARCIAEMHDGRLELAESRPGYTEFRVTLPA